MGSSASLVTVHSWPAAVLLVATVLACAAAAVLIRRLCGIGDGLAEVTAVARACLQLALVGGVIAVVLQWWWSTALFVAVMVLVATVTARTRAAAGTYPVVALAIVVGALPTVLVLMLTGLIPLQPIAVLPIAGIYVGNAMTSCTLALTRASQALRDHHGEVEAALSLGLMEHDARGLVIRPAAALSLVPGLDQTRTVGLVTLPGAFVGTLLGGATPMEAAAVQVLVLGGLMLVQASAVSAVVVAAERGLVGKAAPTGR